MSSASPPDFDAAFFRAALGQFATGVAVVTTRTAEGVPAGMTISSFNSVSLAPPLVLWSLALTSSSRDIFLGCERYVVNVLAADQLEDGQLFARGTRPERSAAIGQTVAPNGTPRLAHSAAWFECQNRSRYEEGDHIILVGEVEHCGHSGVMPLIFHAGGYDLTPLLKPTHP